MSFLINPYRYAAAFKNDYSMSFDGANDYLYINNVENDVDTLLRSSTPQFTISGWFKYTGGTPSSEYAIISKRRFVDVSNCDTSLLVRYQVDNNLGIFCNYSAGNSFLGLVTKQFLTASMWNNFVLIYDYTKTTEDTIAKLFINGQRVTSFVSKEVLTTTNKYFFNASVANRANIKLGYNNYQSNNYYFPGFIDEVSIWNKNLSETEAAEIYNSGAAKNLEDMTAYTTNCIAWYRNGDFASDAWDGSKWTIHNAKGTANTDMISSGMVEANRSTNVPPVISTSLLRFYQKLEGNVTDSSTYSVSVTPSNLTYTSDGKFGSGGIFNGTSTIETLASADYSLTTGFTVMCWMKRGDDLTDVQQIFTSDKTNSSPNVRVWQFGIEDTDEIRFIRFSDNTTVCTNIKSTATITDTNWHHVAAVFDNAVGSKIYIDGNEDGSDTVKTNNYNPSNTPIIGGQLGGAGGAPSNWFKGTLDEVILYTRPLSVTEITTVAAATRPLIT